jgi:hypothetical protein
MIPLEFPRHDARQRGVALMSTLDGLIGYLMHDRKLRATGIAAELERLFLSPARNAGKDKPAQV